MEPSNNYNQGGDFAMPDEEPGAENPMLDKLLSIALRTIDKNRQIVAVFDDKEITLAELTREVPSDLACQLAKQTAAYFGLSDFLNF